jgi:myo-inositol-1(or 4)-monophosphatase
MRMSLNLNELGEFASKIVKEAGALLLKFRKEPIDLEEKGHHSNLVTVADKKVEKFLVDKILEKYPNHGVVGEEGIFENVLENFETEWIIDPIDGTTNFIHNFPHYGISVGIAHKNEGVIGVVYNPLTDELFYGQKDKGAFLNGERLKLTQPIQMKEALVTTTMFWEDVYTRDALHHSIIQLHNETRGIRMVGGAATALCDIAKGTLSAYIVPMLSNWDYAGGVIILKEAGGIITRLNGLPVSFEYGGSILAAHPSIHEELVSMYPDWRE